jgi:hypothetical protein
MTLQNKLQGCLRAQGHEGTIPIFDWTRVVEASRSELPHGIDYGTNDQSNEPVEPPSDAAKD